MKSSFSFPQKKNKKRRCWRRASSLNPFIDITFWSAYLENIWLKWTVKISTSSQLFFSQNWSMQFLKTHPVYPNVVLLGESWCEIIKHGKYHRCIGLILSPHSEKNTDNLTLNSKTPGYLPNSRSPVLIHPKLLAGKHPKHLALRNRITKWSSSYKD